MFRRYRAGRYQSSMPADREGKKYADKHGNTVTGVVIEALDALLGRPEAR